MMFTSSPYEKLMQEPPRYLDHGMEDAPVGTPCHKCPYWRGIACASCYLEHRKTERRERDYDRA